jgi:3-methylfumaryl-CoA hydratase
MRPIHQGDAVERRSTIRAITPKTGSAGPLVFIEVDHALDANGAIALNERHTIVFRSPPDVRRHGGSDKNRAEEMKETPAFTRTIRPDPVLLFRYSALTFNSHRIHYDHPYATQTEGYPGLVVHGPLIATLLLDLAASQHGANALKSFSFRGLAPAFADEPLILQGYVRPGGLHLRAVSGDGRLIVTAEGRF